MDSFALLVDLDGVPGVAFPCSLVDRLGVTAAIVSLLLETK